MHSDIPRFHVTRSAPTVQVRLTVDLQQASPGNRTCILFSKHVLAGDDFEAHAYAVYQIQEDADDWEKKLSAHPSLLDAALQSS